MIDRDVLIADDLISSVIKILRASYPHVRVGDKMPANVDVIMLYTDIPPPRVPTNSHAVHIHFTNGHWITSWQDPCDMTFHILDSKYFHRRIQDIMPRVQ
ncbi:hypothetical protein DPMN_186700 [Dreissena polymorpha]|uniref:Uncharacterized protein n=1 Tax=Dreissena polymorpha TaxID=45954 RepID=A0A9D4DPJ7_DREPO|nr:hypothetical protein DPMN_186700 [Dreissena polymorpha]